MKVVYNNDYKNGALWIKVRKLKIKEYSQAVMIGDREHDIIGAKEHGLSCIGVLYGYGSREEFERYGADCIVETVSELREEL